MILTKNVLPNFLKTVLFAAATAFSMSAFADGHLAEEKIGELKDMSEAAATTEADAVVSELTEEADAATDATEEAVDKAQELKAEIPEG